MLGGDIGRRRRRGLGAVARRRQRRAIAHWPSSSATSMRTATLKRALEALLDAFFTERGEPRGGKSGDLITKGLQRNNRRVSTTICQREQDRLIGLARPAPRRLTVERSEALFAVAKAVLTAFADAKASRGAARFRRPDRARACARDALERRLGPSQARRPARPPPDRRGAGHLAGTMGDPCRAERGVFRRRRRARGQANRVRGRRREAVDLLLPGRRAGEIRRDEARTSRDVIAKPSGPSQTVPLNFSFRSAPAILEAVDKTFASNDGLARRHRRRRAAAQCMRPSVPSHEGRGRAVADDRRAERARSRGLAHAARRAGAQRSSGGAGQPDRGDDREDGFAGFAANASSTTTGAPRRIRPGDVMILVRTPQRVLRGDDPRAEGQA